MSEKMKQFDENGNVLFLDEERLKRKEVPFPKMKEGKKYKKA